MITDIFKLYHNAWISRIPPHKSSIITKRDAEDLLHKGGQIVRNVYNWDSKDTTSFWYVIKDEYGGIEELTSKVRNQVKKSCKVYEFKLVDIKEMTENGFELYNYSRAKFKDKSLLLTKEQWNSRLKGDEKQLWLGYHRETGIPQVFAINRVFDDHCDYVSMGVNPDAPSSTYPMYGLILEMNRFYLAEKNLLYVSDGARSITEHSNIQPFLIDKFKFRKAYCDIQVFYSFWMGLVIRTLFPLRKWIKNKKIAALLNQEAMARNICKE